MLLCVCLSLAGCTGSEEKQLEKMRGEWVHVKGHPAFTLSETGGKYTVTRKANIRGRYWKPPIKCRNRTENCLSKLALPYC